MSDAPPYVVAMCEGDQCLPLLALADRLDHPGDAAERTRLESTLTTLASLLRERGAVGRLVLLDGTTGETITTRQVWP